MYCASKAVVKVVPPNTIDGEEKLPDIDPVFLSYGEKDPSDHIKSFGIRKVKEWLVPLIDKHIN